MLRVIDLYQTKNWGQTIQVQINSVAKEVQAVRFAVQEGQKQMFITPICAVREEYVRSFYLPPGSKVTVIMGSTAPLVVKTFNLTTKED